MICDKYEALSPKGKVILIGELLHAVQSDSHLFDIANEIIKQGKLRGVFEGVTILPASDNLINHDSSKVSLQQT
jgi:hypothetical protein